MVDEYLIWIAALADFVKMYNIQGLGFKEDSIIDKFDGCILSMLQYIAYKLKHKL